MRWRRRRPAEDFAEEIRAHLEMERKRLESDGLSQDDAHAAAHRVFGNVASVQEDYYERDRWVSFDCLVEDFAYALRMLRKTPWFTTATVLILAFAVGANLAVFNLTDALLLRSIPVDRPEELVSINPVGPQGPLNGMPSEVLDPLRQEKIFSGVCGFITPRVTTKIDGVIASTGTLSMTGDCFQTLGVRTQIGRPLTLSDERPESPDVVVLTASLWRRAFGASQDVLGKQIHAGAQSFTVVGVAADRFRGVLLGFEPGLLFPLHHLPSDVPQKRYTHFWVSVFARRAPGVSLETAAARVNAITPALLQASLPSRYDQAQRRNYLANHLAVTSARTGVDWMLRDRFGPPLYALLGICAAVLCIACLNLAALLVARTLARQKELGIRLAIGASMWRVMRPLALESLVLTLGGGVGGILIALWAGRAIAAEASLMFANFSIDPSLSHRSIAVLVGVVLWVAAILGIVPSWQARRSGVIVSLREAGRGIIGNTAGSQKVLIGIQVAFTLALVTVSGVFASSFQSLAHLPLGLRTEGVAEGMLSPVPGGYNFADPKAYYSNLLQRVQAVPGVKFASLSSFALYWQRPTPEVVRDNSGTREVRADEIRISDGYFRTICVRLVDGEDFRRDRSGLEAIVSESVAKRLDVVTTGAYIQVGEKRYRVIGVAPTLRTSMANARESDTPTVYLNFWEDAKEQRYPVLFVQGKHGRQPDARALGSAVQSLGREFVEEFRTLDAQRDQAIAEDRILAYLSTVFGVLALVLAAIGLFSILSGYVASRTSEIGVRMALGADAAQIRRLVLAQLGPMMLGGISAGLVLALVVGRVLANATYGVTTRNPLLLSSAVLALVVTGVAAALIPVKRAVSVEPLEALRRD